jgi:DNA-directed RNA polymerase specialized sigma24 family protein
MAASSAGTGIDPLAALDDDGVWAAVRSLPRDQATAIALRYGADLSVEEVAETLQATVPAVKSLLYRGRAALRDAPAIQSHAR